MTAKEMTVAVADHDGRYEFVGLRPGQFSVLVEGAAHRATHLGASFVDAGGRRQITLKDREVRADANVGLPRAAALVVRVLDEWGEPLAGVSVTLRSATTRQRVPAGLSRRTDDRGIIRLFPLQPASYYICAEPEFGLMFTSKRQAGPRERIVRTCLSADADGAVEVPVAVGGPGAHEVELRMRRSRTFSISGSVLDASGVPSPMARLSLERFKDGGGWGMGISVDAAGRFAMGDIPPGDYAIAADLGGPDRPEHRRPQEAAYLPVRIDAASLDDLTVAMARTVGVKGRVTFDGPAVPSFDPRMAPLLISARLAGDPLSGAGSARSGHMYPDRTFDIDGLFGRRLLDIANVPRGWYVRTLLYGAKEVTDSPVEFKPGDAMLEVVLSTRGASVSGRTIDGAGNPVAGTRVIAFPADRARWWVRQLPTATATKEGRFELGPLRAGDYLIVALAPSSDPAWPTNPDELARLAPLAEPITLRGEETLTLDLNVHRP
jgi:protocatechuate 3,4-dioxygenase beta subunit